MSIIDWFRSSSKDNENRVDKGVAKVNERTIEIGGSIISVGNIGSMVIEDGVRARWPFLWGGVILLLDFFLMKSTSSFMWGLFALLGGSLIFYGFLKPKERYLLIGTSDGRRTSIISTNIKFLRDVIDFIKDKINEESLISGSINIDQMVVVKSEGGGVIVNASGATGGVATGRESETTVE